jgi:hypothetical protein
MLASLFNLCFPVLEELSDGIHKTEDGSGIGS